MSNPEATVTITTKENHMTRKNSAKMMVAAVLATGVALSGCTSDDNEPAPTTTNEDQALTGLEGAGRSPGQQATESAIAAVEGMYKVRAEVSNDPAKDLNLLAQHIGDPALKEIRADVELRRSQGIVSKGELKAISTKPDQLDAPQDRDGNPKPGKAEVLLRTCTDVTDYHSYRGDGSDTIDPNRLPQSEQVYRVVNDSWPSSDGWRVVENTVMEEMPCGEY